MNLRLFPAFAAAGCALLASCYPYDEHAAHRNQDKPGTQKTVTAPEQQKIAEERAKMKEKEKKDEEKKENPVEQPTTDGGGTTADPTGVKPPKEEKKDEKKDYAYANKVPGKDGFVFSPYNNKIVDVRDIPSGTLVQDPTYNGAGKGYFRVP